MRSHIWRILARFFLAQVCNVRVYSAGRCFTVFSSNCILAKEHKLYAQVKQVNSRHRVVIAEDHTILREGLRALLSAESDLEVVGEAEDGRQAIRNFVDFINSAEPLNGCFLLNTWSEQNVVNEASRMFVSDYVKRLETVFREKLDFAVENEGYEGDAEVDARNLAIYMLGIAQFYKTGLSPEEMKQQAFVYLDANGI